MRLRHLIVFTTCSAALLLSGCTTRYQELLREKDMEIRKLENDNAQLAAARADAERREREAQSALRGLQEAPARPAEAATGNSDVERVARDLPGLDVRYKNGRVSIGIDNTVTFDSGSAQLKSSAGQVLAKVGKVLERDFAGHRIYVEGHTDTDPIRKTADRFRSNRHLSAERADAVAAYLIDKCGIAERNIVVVGYGPFDPREVGRGDAAKSKNRRVEIVVGDRM